jgi:hypothetical protein
MEYFLCFETRQKWSLSMENMKDKHSTLFWNERDVLIFGKGGGRAKKRRYLEIGGAPPSSSSLQARNRQGLQPASV